MKIGTLITEGRRRLKTKNIESYILDSELLLCKIIGKDRIYVLTHKEEEVSKEAVEMFREWLTLRENHMPVKYITGECEFMGLKFQVKPGVLIPRPETEVLVERVLSTLMEGRYKTVCDVCCGSGAIGLSLAHYSKNVKVWCSDIDKTALYMTDKNRNALGLSNNVEIVEGDLLNWALVEGVSFDVIVSNPPYIKEEVIPTLMEEVRVYEPHIALSGGDSGLDFYRIIVKQAKELLNPGGLLAFEIGYDQKAEVHNLMELDGFQNFEFLKDLSGKDRVILGVKGC